VTHREIEFRQTIFSNVWMSVWLLLKNYGDYDCL